ncbi:MAG: heparinase II/III family protein [Acidimicrobiia bacterium]|nr:heparinase II/III family protein [Acidimicrobiia bacterium]MDH4364661.1 heparinase II/III family protein [Acidimicrobiia bacterium]MDH5288730.1 heparinase II/III family protein [Acidimicrobiia bacterium]
MPPPPTITAAIPRPVLCVIDHLHRSPAVADAAVAGRYVHAGRELSPGRQPDWLRAADGIDEEWGIEWVKLYEGLDLGSAFAATGQRPYLDTWEDLVESFCLQVPVGHHTSDVSARRIQNWLYAWQRFAAAPGYPGLRTGLAERLTARIEADVAHLAAHLTAERNHRTLEIYTLVLAALAFDRTHDASAALELLADNAAADIGDDGVHRERSSDYHCLVLRSLVGAVACAAGTGLEVPPVLVDRVDRAATVALHLQRPDGTMPALSDGDQSDFRALLALAADVLDRPDLSWGATLGGEGRAPAELGATFAAGGYVVQRSGWGDGPVAYGDEAWAVLDCGPLGDGGHGHYDQLSVELHTGGRTVVVDPGRFTYDRHDGPWRHWFKGTAAHNTVTVDGLDQVTYRPGKPRGPLPQARLVRRHDDGRHDTVMAAATSPNHDATHRRTLRLCRMARSWLVVDEMTAPAGASHRYDLRWHLAPEAWGTIGRQDLPGRVEFTVPGARITIVDPPGPVRIAPGWVSPAYGVRHPAPVVVVTARDAASTRFITEVAPC